MNAKQPIYKAGTTIAGKYRIDKAIARGGCSIVYRGTHVGMDRPVALKIMSLVDGRVDSHSIVGYVGLLVTIPGCAAAFIGLIARFGAHGAFEEWREALDPKPADEPIHEPAP